MALNLLRKRVKETESEKELVGRTGDRWDGRLCSLLRKQYLAQGDAVMVLCKLLRDYDSAIVVGEMGCGKTMIGASALYVYDNGDKPARA